MEIKRAIEVAQLWRAGKLLGEDESEVREALLQEVERLGKLQPFKFGVTTSAVYYTPAQAEKLKTLGFSFVPVQFDETNCLLNKELMFKSLRITDKEGEIEISTLEELIKFSDDFGGFNFKKGSIEIAL